MGLRCCLWPRPRMSPCPWLVSLLRHAAWRLRLRLQRVFWLVRPNKWGCKYSVLGCPSLWQTPRLWPRLAPCSIRPVNHCCPQIALLPSSRLWHRACAHQSGTPLAKTLTPTHPPTRLGWPHQLRTHLCSLLGLFVPPRIALFSKRVFPAWHGSHPLPLAIPPQHSIAPHSHPNHTRCLHRLPRPNHFAMRPIS